MLVQHVDDLPFLKTIAALGLVEPAPGLHGRVPVAQMAELEREIRS